MNLETCKLCGRLFKATRGKICVTCLDELDDLYPKVREYIRDHPKEAMNIEDIADGMDIDIRRVHALVELGYIDRGIKDSDLDADRQQKENLARQLQASLDASAASKSTEDGKKSTYGQQRYGTGRK